MTGMDLINIAKETIKFTQEYIKKNNSSISAAKVFGYEHLRDIEKDKYYKENMYGAYYKLDYDMPLCNHKECMSDSHLGFAKGITYDGVPFEAELTQHDKTKTLCVIMPAIFYSSPIKVDLEKENISFPDLAVFLSYNKELFIKQSQTMRHGNLIKIPTDEYLALLTKGYIYGFFDNYQTFELWLSGNIENYPENEEVFPLPEKNSWDEYAENSA